VLRKGVAVLAGTQGELIDAHYRLIALASGLLVACSQPANDGYQGYMEGEFVLLASPNAGQLQKLW
jgi:hypothetical protein